MTVERRDKTYGNYETPWGRWIRENPRLDSVAAGLSITDSDLWIHRYLSSIDRRGTREIQHIMLVEFKSFGRTVPEAQKDTFAVINALLRSKHNITIRLPGTRAPKRLCRVWGVHVLRMSGACPGSSERLWWDGKPITLGTLEQLLRLELHPDTLKPRSDRRHHSPSDMERIQPKLEEVSHA